MSNPIAIERKKRRMTQEQLAQRVGVTKNTIRLWEQGQIPYQSNQIRLCQAFDVPLEMLFPQQQLPPPILPSATYPRDHESTYIVSLQNQEETERLNIQDILMTQSMGGVFPELAHPERLRQVLDVACGTGHWLREVARTYPTIETLMGIDISENHLRFARHQKGLDRRINFQQMDALKLLPLSDQSFDLVNHRFGISWARRWEWIDLLREYRRITRQGGIVRITECDVFAMSDRPAFSFLADCGLEAFRNSGRLLSDDDIRGIQPHLPDFFERTGIRDIHTRQIKIHYTASEPLGQAFIKDVLLMLRTTISFLRKWSPRTPEDQDSFYQQLRSELYDPTFEATLRLTTVWGYAL